MSARKVILIYLILHIRVYIYKSVCTYIYLHIYNLIYEIGVWFRIHFVRYNLNPGGKDNSIWIKEENKPIIQLDGLSVVSPKVLQNLTTTYLKFGYNLPSVFHTITISITNAISRGMITDDFTRCQTGCTSNDCLGMTEINFNGHNKCMNKGIYMYILLYSNNTK